MNHQKISEYGGELYGEPRYQGIEYDWEVPDNIVVASPGGVSSIHHHWTKGFDGRGNSSSDVYAGQGQRYNSGVYGNLYQTGHESGQAAGYYPRAPDYQYWQNQEPSQYSYTHSKASTWAPAMKIHGSDTAYQSSPDTVIEGYKPSLYEAPPQQPEIDYQMNTSADFDLLQPSDEVDISATAGGPATLHSSVYENYEKMESDQESLTLVAIPSFRPWIVLFLFLFGFIVYDAWASAGHSYITQVWNKGKSLNWKQYLLYAVVMTAVLVGAMALAGIPLHKFEHDGL